MDLYRCHKHDLAYSDLEQCPACERDALRARLAAVPALPPEDAPSGWAAWLEDQAERDALKARVTELAAELAKIGKPSEDEPSVPGDTTAYGIGRTAYSSVSADGLHALKVWARSNKCRADKAEATLAQRDREVLGLRQVLENLRANFCAMTSSPIIESWIVMADTALASTAQAGAEAEQRIGEDEREKWVALIRWLNGEADDFPARPEKVEGKPWPLYWWRTELMHRVAAILGTGGETVDLSKCPKCGGPADNGHDRCLPPNPYFCTKCESGEAR